MDRRQKAIDTIRALYPPDSIYEGTRAVGNRLLEQARRDCASWESEPDAVLERFAQLCLEMDQRATGH